jgi:hypothetical protein
LLQTLDPGRKKWRWCRLRKGKKTKEGQKTELGRQERLPSYRKGGEGIEHFGYYRYLVKMPEQLTGLALGESALVHCARVVCNTQICRYRYWCFESVVIESGSRHFAESGPGSRLLLDLDPGWCWIRIQADAESGSRRRFFRTGNLFSSKTTYSSPKTSTKNITAQGEASSATEN